MTLEKKQLSSALAAFVGSCAYLASLWSIITLRPYDERQLVDLNIVTLVVSWFLLSVAYFLWQFRKTFVFHTFGPLATMFLAIALETVSSNPEPLDQVIYNGLIAGFMICSFCSFPVTGFIVLILAVGRAASSTRCSSDATRE